MNGNYDFDNFNYDTSEKDSASSNSDFDTSSTYFDDSIIYGNAQSNTPKQSEEDAKKEKSASTASFVLGLYTLISVFVCCGVFNIITGIISIVYANKAKKLSQFKKMPTNATAGFICSIIGMALGAIIIIYFIFVIIIAFSLTI